MGVTLPFEVEHRLAWIVAGCFAGLSAFITCYQVYNHLKYNSHPELRRFVIRIILMVPIYALESWLGLRFADIALYFDLLRECYEAFVIYSFYQLLVTYLGGERELVKLLSKKPEKPHVVPFCWLPHWRMSDRFQIQFSEEEMERLQQAMNERARTARPAAETVQAQAENKEDLENSLGSSSVAASAVPTAITVVGANPSPDFSAAASSPDLLREAGSVPERPTFSPRPPRIPPSYLSPYSRPHHSDFLTHTQLGTLQYCIAKPVTALLAFILSLLDLYGDSNFDWSKGYPYLSFVTNMSQIWAMYTLVLFYLVCKDDLVGLRPVPKFLCVKAVVFFTFWQGVLIAILAGLGILHETEHYTKEEVVVALQDFIVCIEMLVAALAHHYAFSWKDFHDPILHRTRPETQMLPALIEALNVSDVYMHDVRRITKKSLKAKAKDNRVLTREEMHEMQYASFVAATSELGEQGAAFEDLSQPLNPSVDDSSSVSDFRGSYVSPTLVRPAPPAARDSALQMERLHEVHRREDRSDDGARSITTVTVDRLRVSPVPPQMLEERKQLNAAPTASTVTFEPLDDELAAPSSDPSLATATASSSDSSNTQDSASVAPDDPDQPIVEEPTDPTTQQSGAQKAKKTRKAKGSKR